MSIIIPTSEQLEAIESAKEWYLSNSTKPFVIMGCAGSGKSSVVSLIVDSFGLNPEDDVKYVTFTGKAASVLIKKGNPATTIHKLIYDPVIGANGRIVGFKKKSKLDEDIKVIVIDEFYMVNDTIMKDLLSFNIKIICLGDNNQLPPPFGKVNELANKPDAVLTQPLRQSLDNPIIYLATQAMKRQRLKLGDYGNGVKVISKNALEIYKMEEADQIIVGKNKTVRSFNKFYRKCFLDIDPKDYIPKKNEKLLCLKNNWSRICYEGNIGTNLVNGLTLNLTSDIFDVSALAYGKGNLQPDFYENSNFKDVKLDLLYFLYNFTSDDELYNKDNWTKLKYENILKKREIVFGKDQNAIDKFTYGYTITTHKSQGSEWNNVFFIFEPFGGYKTDGYWQMLYTGITRAKEKLIIAI